jgi:hypothetical protein
MASAAKKIQEKLFGGGSTQNGQQSQDRGDSGGLTINIPKAQKPPPTPVPPPKSAAKPIIDSGPKTPEDRDTQTYRQRLAQKLGGEYEGAEKYRLLQDGKKERHWKRWGPYLSDRQWVRLLRMIAY